MTRHDVAMSLALISLKIHRIFARRTHTRLARYSFFCFRSKRVDRCCVGVEHEEYLEAVDLTSCVGTIPTWLASYFLV